MARKDVDTGRTYGSSARAMTRVVRRDGKLTIDDDGAAVRLAGRPEARLDRLVDLVAVTSLEVYDALLDER